MLIIWSFDLKCNFILRLFGDNRFIIPKKQENLPDIIVKKYNCNIKLIGIWYN